MRRMSFIRNFTVGFLTTALSLPAYAANDLPASPPAPTCGTPGAVNCVPTKKDLKEAHNAFTRGIKLREQQHLEDAFHQFDEAAHLAPQNSQFVAARDVLKAQLVFNHVERGNQFLAEYLNGQAAAEFRAALELDPDDAYARERLAAASRDSTADSPHVVLPPQPELAGAIEIDPKADRTGFHYRGDLRGLYNEIAQAYGVSAQFDDTMPTRQVRFIVDDLDFSTAMRLAGEVGKTMWTPLGAKQFLVAADNSENHKRLDHMLLETFPLPPASSQQEITDVMNLLRTLFDLKTITQGQTVGTIDIRATGPVLAACSQLLEQISNERPQVAIDVHVYQIDHQLMRNIGLQVPNTFNLYNIPAAAVAGLLSSLGGQNASSLINQLISSGGINQAGSSALSGLLAQLQGQTSGIFSQPLATFGGGLTFMGLSLGQLNANLSVNESWARSLEAVTLRAGSGVDTELHVGERYPIQNASYAPIYNSPQISAVLGNNSYTAPFPSVSYEDLGLNMKAKPVVQGNGTVSLHLNLQVRSLTGDSNNGIPVISNREFEGGINLVDGESAVVAGQISVSDTLAMTGIPGFGLIPGLNKIASNNTRQEDDDELMIIVTPHIVANTIHHTPEIWLSEK
jgi:general secretion pathway protein D